MATGNDKNQSAIIAHRLPEFVQTDHPTMVAFVQAYYEWLDQQASQGYLRTPNALDGLADVDKTIDEFVAAFKNEYLLDFPEEFAVNPDGNSVDVRQLVKHIKEFYRNKGTEKTYEFLFRILYDTAVEFYYPARDIIRLSDGKWIQKYSIRCSNNLGKKIFESRGKTVVQKSVDGSVLASGKVIDATVYQIGSRQVAELFLSNINGRFRSNTDAITDYAGIEFTDNNDVLQRETFIYPVISKVTITSQGTNYRKGDRIFFTPNVSDTGQGAVATIIEVDGNGGILKTRIDNFGVGYQTSPTASFESAFGLGGAVTATVGTVCNYPGYYSNNDGRLSTNKVMQDNQYYQNFSYVLLTEVVIDRYKDILRRLIHPAGMGMFGRVVINRCNADNVSTDALAKRTDTNTTIGNYSPYTLYTYNDMGSLFANGRSLPYIPDIDDATITGAGGNPAGLTGLTSAHYQVTFSPKDITGLKIWLDGKTLAGAAGATVGAWDDSSGNGFTASASLQNLYPTVSDMGGLRLTGSVGTFGSVLTTPSLTGALNQRSLFVAFTPYPVPTTDTSQQNCVVVGLMRNQGDGYTSAYTGHYYQHHTICVDYSQNTVDTIGPHTFFEPSVSLTPRIAAYYGVGNHDSIGEVYLSDLNGNRYTSTTYGAPTAGRALRVNNTSSVVYSPFEDANFSTLTTGNANTSIVSSVIAENDSSLTSAAYFDSTEVIQFDKRSNTDLSIDARYYRYQKMAEFTATEDGSYNFSMEMKRDSDSVWGFKGVISKNDGLVETGDFSQQYVPNQLAQWQERSMSNGDGAGTWSPTSYKVHSVSVKDIKAGDVIRIWMSPSYNDGSKQTNGTLNTAKALYLRNFTVNKIYSQDRNLLTVNGTEVGTAIANLNGITQGQRLTIGLGQNFFNGVVHEVLLYDRAVTKQERETIEAYLYKRWTGNIIPATNHSWHLPIESNSLGIYPALPTEGGYTANAAINTEYGYPFFVVSNHPNIALADVDQPYAARILYSQASDFLGGGTGTDGYWVEWSEGATANRQNWWQGLSAAGEFESRHALLNYSTSSEFRKITAEAFLDRKIGVEFDCKNETLVEPPYPQVNLFYSTDFTASTVYSNGTIIFNYKIDNLENMDYWITDQLEVEISDGRKLYRYRPESDKWKNGSYGEFRISGFTSEGSEEKAYTVTFRLKNYYGKTVSTSEASVSFVHKYADLFGPTNSL